MEFCFDNFDKNIIYDKITFITVNDKVSYLKNEITIYLLIRLNKTQYLQLVLLIRYLRVENQA